MTRHNVTYQRDGLTIVLYYLDFGDQFFVFFLISNFFLVCILIWLCKKCFKLNFKRTRHTYHNNQLHVFHNPSLCKSICSNATNMKIYECHSVVAWNHWSNLNTIFKMILIVYELNQWKEIPWVHLLLKFTNPFFINSFYIHLQAI